MSDALKAATEALALQLEITRDHGSLTWSEADWMLDAHGDDILAALRDREQAIAAEREACAKVADEWAQSKSCSHHDDNPCCHVRLGATIRDRIRARGKEAGDANPPQ